MLQIYKLGYIVNNEIRGIYVFSGLRKRLHDRDINMNELYVSDRANKIFENIFSPEEQREIDEKSIPVLFIEQTVYADDTVETIKKKIIMAVSQDKAVSFDEIYLFCEEMR